MSKQDDSSLSRSFVGRWSQRKLKVKAEQKPSATEAVQVEEPLPVNDVLIGVEDDPQHQAMATFDEPNTVSDFSAEIESGEAIEPHLDEEEEPLLTDEQMPDIATLDSKSDVSPFFNRGVSAELRKAALRHFFSLPIHNIRDGLNDYDEDYTVWEPLGDVVTSDMKFHERRKEKERLEKERLAAEEAERELEEEANQDEQPSSDEEDNEKKDELVAEDETPTTDDEESIDDVEIEAVDNQSDLLTSNDEVDSTSTDKNVTEHA